MNASTWEGGPQSNKLGDQFSNPIQYSTLQDILITHYKKRSRLKIFVKIHALLRRARINQVWTHSKKRSFTISFSPFDDLGDNPLPLLVVHHELHHLHDLLVQHLLDHLASKNVCHLLWANAMLRARRALQRLKSKSIADEWTNQPT